MNLLIAKQTNPFFNEVLVCTPYYGKYTPIHHIMGSTRLYTTLWEIHVYTPHYGKNTPVHHIMGSTRLYTTLWEVHVYTPHYGKVINRTPFIFYIIKQDIRLYVPYSRPNGWTDWAEIFCGHSGEAEG